MANEITIRVTAKDDASRVFDVVDKRAKTLGDTFSKVGKIAAGFLLADSIQGAFQKIAGGMGDAVKQASDLRESVNAVNQIFDDSAQTILDWGQNNATAFGLSQRAFNQLATPLGAMLKGQGFQDFTGLTIELTKRAADMASVFNTDVTDALAAVQAALRGEIDPIERYGVSLNAAQIEARALADTGKTVASALTDQEKAAARVALIFEKTADVQGDFANTSDEAANKARIQAAKMEELSAALGEKLLPIQMKITEAKLAFVNVMVSKVIPALESLYAKHWPALAKVIDTIRPVVEFMVQDVAAKIGGFVGMFTSVVDGVKSVIATIDALIRGDWSTAWDNFKIAAENGAKLAVNTAVAAFGALPNVMIGIMEQVLNIVIDGWNKVAGVFSQEINLPKVGNINPLAGQDLTQGNINLPRLPQLKVPFEDIGEAFKELASTTTAVDAGMVNLAVNSKDAAAAVKSVTDRLNEAMSALFGRGTREETELDLKIAQAEKRLLIATGEQQRKQIEKEIDTLRNRASIMDKDNQIAQLRIELADQTLLTEREQNRMTGLLIQQTQTLTSQMAYAATAAGRFAQALGVVLGQGSGTQYTQVGNMPFARRDLELMMGQI